MNYRTRLFESFEIDQIDGWLAEQANEGYSPVTIAPTSAAGSEGAIMTRVLIVTLRQLPAEPEPEPRSGAMAMKG